MQDNKTKTLVPIESPEFDFDNLDSLDINKLKDDMLKGIYVLESTLFSQAGFEFERIKNMRFLIDSIEKEVFTEQTISQLAPMEKIKLYQLIQGNMNMSLNFLQNLHKNVESGLSTITQMEKISSERVKARGEDQVTANPDLDKIKQLIQDKIKEKIEGKK
jgi:hypothetical protein